jgi:hypothetical protein
MMNPLIAALNELAELPAEELIVGILIRRFDCQYWWHAWQPRSPK